MTNKPALCDMHDDINALLPSHLDELMVILEIPHQRKPSIWYAFDEEEFMSKVSEVGYDEYHYGELTKDSAIEWVMHDLRGGQVFQGPDMLFEMHTFVQRYDTWQYAQERSLVIDAIEFITGREYFPDDDDEEEEYIVETLLAD